MSDLGDDSPARWAPPGADVRAGDGLERLGRWLVWQQLAARGLEVVNLAIGGLALTLLPAGTGAHWAASTLDGTATPALTVVVVAWVMLAAGSTLMFVLGALLWVPWHLRAARRVAERQPLAHRPLAHGVWWFVPVAQLFMPYLATAELLGRLPNTPGILVARARLPTWWVAWCGWMGLRWLAPYPSEMHFDDVPWFAATVVGMEALGCWATWAYVRMVRTVTGALTAP